MKRVSISALKARLSEHLEAVKQGEQLLITDRGHPVASVSPVVGDRKQSARTDQLVRAGRLRPPRAPLPASFWKDKAPADPSGKALRALLEERADGR